MAEPQLIRILGEFNESPVVTYELEDKITEFKEKADDNYINNKEPVWDNLLNQYGDNVKLKNWKERTLATTNILHCIGEENNKIHLKGSSIDSYSIDAFRNGYWGKDLLMENFPFYNWIVMFALHAGDDKLIFGERSGKNPAWAFGGGHIKFNAKDNNLLNNAVYSEANEEIGKNLPYKNPKLRSIFAMEKGSFKGIKVFYELFTDALSKDIIEGHKIAYSHYLNEKNNGKSEDDARKSLEEFSDKTGHPSSAWEHLQLIAVDNNQVALKNFYDEKMKAGNLMSVAQGSLESYLRSISK